MHSVHGPPARVMQGPTSLPQGEGVMEYDQQKKLHRTMVQQLLDAIPADKGNTAAASRRSRELRGGEARWGRRGLPEQQKCSRERYPTGHCRAPLHPVPRAEFWRTLRPCDLDFAR